MLATQDKHALMATQLEQHHLSAYFVPAEDEHLNEYTAPHKKRVQWLTGFTGEAAPVIVTLEKPYLFVDGRFHVQVDHEVDGTTVCVQKLGEPGALKTTQQLRHLFDNALKQGKLPFRIGYDPFTLTQQQLSQLEKGLGEHSDLEWVGIDGNLVDAAQGHRDPSADEPSMAFRLPPEIHGMSTTEKLAMLREILAEKKTHLLPVTRLDDIAWLLNIRGGDIPYNPVVESYLLITPTQATWYVREAVVTDALKAELQQDGIQTKPYDAYVDDTKTLLHQLEAEHKRVWLDPSGSTLGTQGLYHDCHVHRGLHPITELKAIKNQTEAHWMAEANRQASIALMTHFAWAEHTFAAGGQLSEVDLRDHIEATYRSRPNFHDLSFPTIPGLGANSAIIHYCEADPAQKAVNGGWYLLDSGAHYVGGTTDTTRTTVFGTPDERQIDCYTAVLRAHIACAKQVFPEGTNGTQLDAITRAPLWQAGLNFTHGTGHGVGAFLNVHEGPNRISPACQTAFEPGMVTSNEPGYYVPGWGGIRLENLYIVEEAEDVTPFMGKLWLRFKSLTLVPFEKKLIRWSVLNTDEIAWLKAFYVRIQAECGPELDASTQAWLSAQCDI
jgi:Xaa-Pro aminopeptidase